MLINYCHIPNQTPPNCLIAKFCAKILKFGTKNALFGYFGLRFWKTVVISEVSTLEFALLQSFLKKNKNLKFGTKNARFLYFGAGIWKYHCQIWNQCPRICLATRFGANIDILKFRIKKAWYEYFWTGSWRLYLKSAPSNLSNWKISWNNEVSKFETKRAFFWAKI